MGYRLAASKVHLTYKTHLNREEWEEKFIGPLLKNTKVYSFVHEVGDENEENPTPYEHTHIFWYGDKIDTTNVRFFDFQDIHPNIQTKRSLQWAKVICTKYHAGHKTKKDGKKYFIEPVMLHQVGVESWKFEEDLWKQIQEAPSLEAACAVADVQPRSISDVLQIRNHKRPREEKSDYTLAEFEWEPITEWNGAYVFMGEPQIGKTQFALAHFEHPCFVCTDDDLRNFDPSFHDGIVFDDYYCKYKPTVDQIHIADWNNSRSIKVRFVTVHIPAKTKKIFTCNPERYPFVDDPAIEARVTLRSLNVRTAS